MGRKKVKKLAYGLIFQSSGASKKKSPFLEKTAIFDRFLAFFSKKVKGKSFFRFVASL